MSTQVTRLKKYGKKPRSFRDVDRVFLAGSSPEKPPLKKKQYLRETTGNAQGTPLKQQHNSDKHNPQDLDVRTHQNSQQYNISKDEALTHGEDLLSDLALHVSSLHLDSEGTDVAEDGSNPLAEVVRQIAQIPADISEKTKSYLEPLLSCKNVSKIVESFQGWMSNRRGLFTLSKIGEGSFGEVYRATGDETVILKLMPLSARRGKGARSFTSIADARNEVRLLVRMSKVPGFVEFRGACVLQGIMPDELKQRWDEYKASGRTVESKNPHKKDSYPMTQLWLLVEMSDAGQSLEPGRYAPPGALALDSKSKKTPYLPVHYTWDIFWQVAKALAKGELFASYEHRDLHLGNICVKDCNHTHEPAIATDRHHLGIGRAGVEVTLIDYSLSRASASRNGDEVMCYDFKNDKVLLRGQGDLQYEMYRHMARVLGDRRSVDFVPETNILWLWYMLKLLLQVTNASEKAREGDNEKSDSNVACYVEMLTIMKELEQTLRPENCAEWPWRSADSMLDMGVKSKWFTMEEVTDT